MISRARLLALRPPRPPVAELEAVPLGVKGGHPYERRLVKLLKRAWDGGVEDAVVPRPPEPPRPACPSCGRPS